MSEPIASVRAFIALGSNLGEPLKQIDEALTALGQHAEIDLLTLSKVYQTAPHGPQDQPDFINAVVEINTTLSPLALLDAVNEIEQLQGRERLQHWGPRTIDLDIILYGDYSCATEKLTIPHLCAHEREFVLQPLMDIDTSLSIGKHGQVSELITPILTGTMRVIRDVRTYHD